jgi:hypothetical protein
MANLFYMIKKIKKSGIMSQEATELRSAWSFLINERGQEYRFTAKLYRSKLVIDGEAWKQDCS